MQPIDRPHEMEHEAQLTAYVLGELDEAGRNEIEALMAGNPALREEVESIRAMAELLGEELAGGEDMRLDEVQRAQVLEMAQGAAQEAPRRAWTQWFGLAAAAGLLFVLGAGMLLAAGRVTERTGLSERGRMATASVPQEEPEAEAATPAPASPGQAARQIVPEDVDLEGLPDELREQLIATGYLDAKGKKAAPAPAEAEAEAIPPELRRQMNSLGYLGKDDEKSSAKQESRPEALAPETGDALVSAGRLANENKAARPGVMAEAVTEEQEEAAGASAESPPPPPPPPSLKPPNMAALRAQEEEVSTSAVSSAGGYRAAGEIDTSTLQKVQVGGDIRIRADYFADGDGQGGYGGGAQGGDGGYGGGYRTAEKDINGNADVEIYPTYTPQPNSAVGMLKVYPFTLPEGSTSPDKKITSGFRGESYAPIEENRFRVVKDEPLSTFSVDVDTASYANVRRFLDEGRLPPPDAVRIEELINYFAYSYPEPEGDAPFSVNVDIHPCPWDEEHRLARIGLKGKTLAVQERPPCNLVFLLDVSGSMVSQDKLPLLKKAMKLLVKTLGKEDRIGIVTYNTTAHMALPSTPCSKQQRISHVLDMLEAGGSTNGGAGLEQAYAMASEHYAKGAVNRVILATDGDFNVGVTSKGSLVDLITRQAKSGVFLSVLGFGEGNLKDDNLEALADKGNGNYAYIDSFSEARKVMFEEVAANLIAIAKDVKIQIEFNPGQVGAYRLIGYENRVMAAKDFNDDRKDAGEIGSGHTVTALYELVPAGSPLPAPGIDPLKYQQPAAEEVEQEEARAEISDEWMTVKLRYKQPEGKKSQRIEVPVMAENDREPSRDFQFAASVAAFGMLLRDSAYKGEAEYDMVLQLANQGRSSDPEGRRAEFIGLVKTAAALSD